MSKITSELWEIEDERLRQEGLDEDEQAKRFDEGLGFVCSCTSYSSCPGVANAGVVVPNLLKRQAD